MTRGSLRAGGVAPTKPKAEQAIKWAGGKASWALIAPLPSFSLSHFLTCPPAPASRWHLQLLQEFLHHAARGHAAEARLRVHHHAVRDHRHGHLLHVLRRHELAAVEERRRLRHQRVEHVGVQALPQPVDGVHDGAHVRHGQECAY